MRRQTPFADIVAHLTPFFVDPAGRLRRGPGRHRPGRPHAGLPDLPAGRLLRGRGRPGDHAQAADHQHPRRAARRRRQVPPAARDHRRRQPVRDLDLPQGRHDVAGAGDDRGRSCLTADLAHRRPGGRAAGGQPRPDADPPDPAARRPPADRARSCSGRTCERARQVRRRPRRRRRRRADRATCSTAGRGARPARPRPDAAAPTSWTGWPSCGCWRATATREGLGWALAQAAAGRPAVLRRPAGEGALPPAGRPRLDAAAAHRRRGPRAR